MGLGVGFVLVVAGNVLVGKVIVAQPIKLMAPERGRSRRQKTIADFIMTPFAFIFIAK